MITKMGTLYILIGLAGIYLAANVLFHFFATPLMFPYSGSSYRAETFPDRVVSTTGDSIAIRYEPGPAPRFLVIYHHGNGEDIGHLDSRLGIFHDLELAVLAYDFPGYGQSTGRPTEAGVYAAAEAAQRYATDSLGWAPDRLIQYGRSLGGGPALYLATTSPIPPAGVILECTFRSIRRVVTQIPLLVPDRFPNQNRIRSIRSPLFILHGQADTIVPVHHGQTLLDLAPDPKSGWFPTIAGHNNLFETAPDELRQELETFLRTLHSPKAGINPG